MESASQESSAERVYITGLGPVCSLGVGIEAFAGALWERPYRVRELAAASGQERPVSVRRVPAFDLNNYVKSKRSYVDPHSAFALAAGSLALASSRGQAREIPPGTGGLAMGTVFGNTASQEIFQQGVRLKGVRLASPVLFQHCYPNTTNSLLCIEFGLRGYNQNFCGDSLCGAQALQAAWEAIRDGLADLMLVGGCDALGDRLSAALRREYGADGLVLGEGACFIVLENQRSVRRRDSTPVCEVVSVASAGTGLPGPPRSAEAEGQIAAATRLAISRALAQAGLWEGDLGIVFLAMPWQSQDLLCRAALPTLSSLSQVPTFAAQEVGGYAFAATFLLQCAAAVIFLNQRAVPSPLKLEGVEKGVELWVEQPPTSVLGTAALLLAWSAHSVVAAILKAP